tara:strand:- start:83 stop:244 length:162 start_codon:yes stop_codon:yes gene_type:complete
MEQVLSEILDKVETIDELLDGENDDMQVVIDELWAFIKDEKHKLYLESLWEVK